MPMTRRQYRQWRDEGFPEDEPSDNEEQCEECAQDDNDQRSEASQESNYSLFDMIDPNERPFGPEYSENDRCKRHRNR